jgi:epoxyqueuosine reductase
MIMKTAMREKDTPFPVPDYRFDQKNDMFKRVLWDEKMKPYGEQFYREIKYQEKAGYRKIDYAFRNASWNLEWSAGFGNVRSNSGLYSWEGVSDRIKAYVEAGGSVRESPQEMSRIIKKVACFFGADLVGICRVHPNWIYSHEYNKATGEHTPIEIPEGCHHAIVMAIAMDYKCFQMSPSAEMGAAAGLGYSKMAFVANLVATFIRGLGYRALPSGNDTAISIPLAVAAGLGESGRSGLLITRKFGPRVRICKVFTDLSLHYDAYQPFGVHAFCEVCKKCAKYCPSQAIPHGNMTTEGYNISNHSGVMKWYANMEKCFIFWAKNHMECGNCIRVCPFNKPPGVIHDISRAMIRRTPLFNRPLLWVDDLLQYDKPLPTTAFWDNSC